MSALLVPALWTAAFLAFGAGERVRHEPGLLWAFALTGALLIAWQVALAIDTLRGRRFVVQRRIVRAHYVQAAVQFCIYAYWGWFWQPVYDQAPLIAAQICFLGALNALLGLTRRSRCVLGFGELPIVLSTNFFLWFHDDLFLAQFAMLALGAFGKEFVRWKRDGESTHIFNPSALALALVSVILIATGTTDRTWGIEIATTLAFPDYIYTQIFALGIVVQLLFAVTLVTMGAVVMLLLLNAAWSKTTGIFFFTGSNIPIADFLGIHLLVTDPATSPRRDLGRLAFGALYGVSIFGLYGVLTSAGIPAFYDKILCVPLLNLGVRRIDRWSIAAETRLVSLIRPLRAAFTGDPRKRNLVHVGIWTAIFIPVLATGVVGRDHPGMDPAFWRQACLEERSGACVRLAQVLRAYCAAGSGPACNELGWSLLDGGPLAGRIEADAVTPLAHACQLGEIAGCSNLALRCTVGGECPGWESSLAAASERLRASCLHGRADHCFAAGQAAIASGAGAGRLAVEPLQHGCDSGTTDACVALARLHLFGDAGPKDPLRAAQAFVRACRLGDAGSCQFLEVVEWKRDESEPSVELAARLARHACELGEPRACADEGM